MTGELDKFKIDPVTGEISTIQVKVYNIRFSLTFN